MQPFFAVLVCFLSVYGAFCILYSIVCHFVGKNNFKPKYFHTIVGVDDNCRDIEIFLRSYRLKEYPISEMILINYSSCSEMNDILNIASRDFDNIRIMSPEEYDMYIKSLC